jgi:hypothetical protein
VHPVVPSGHYDWAVEWWPAGARQALTRGRRLGTRSTEAQAWAAAEQTLIEKELHYPNGP